MSRHRVDNLVEYIGMGLAAAFVVGCGWWWATGQLLETPVLHAVLMLTGAATCSLLLCWLWLALADLTHGVPPLRRHRRRTSARQLSHACEYHLEGGAKHEP